MSKHRQVSLAINYETNDCNYVSPYPCSKFETPKWVSHLLPPMLSPYHSLKWLCDRLPVSSQVLSPWRKWGSYLSGPRVHVYFVFILVWDTTFQWLNSHNWLVATILDSMGLNNNQISSSASDFTVCIWILPDLSLPSLICLHIRSWEVLMHSPITRCGGGGASASRVPHICLYLGTQSDLRSSI